MGPVWLAIENGQGKPSNRLHLVFAEILWFELFKDVLPFLSLLGLVGRHALGRSLDLLGFLENLICNKYGRPGPQGNGNSVARPRIY